MKTLARALQYAAFKWYVFPLAGKRPLTPNGYLDATDDPEQIRQWWTKSPDADIAVACRPSGFIAIDADNLATFAKLEEKLGPLPRDAVQKTARGMHVLVADPSPGPNGWTRTQATGGSIRGKFPGGVDVKCNGYIVVEPADGKEWVALPDDGVLPDMPARWITAVKKPEPTTDAPGVEEWSKSTGPLDEEEGQRLCGVLAELTARGEGGSVTFRALSTIFHGYGLSVEQGWPYVVWWNDQCTEPHSTSELHRQVRRIADAEHTGARGYMRSKITEAFAPSDPTTAAVETTTTAAPDEWSSREQIAREIHRRKDEPWITIGVDGKPIAPLRAGSTVTLQGGTGAGKSSLAASLILNHCEKPNHYALVLSAELPFDEFGARMAGIKLGKTWGEMLRGDVSETDIVAALPARLAMVDREAATFETLAIKLQHFRLSHPDAVLLVVFDYGQILDAPGDDVRSKVGGVWIAADKIARAYKTVSLVLSQMSRANSKGARHGERLGADAIDGGAETAAIERWSTMVLEIGSPGTLEDDGWRDMSLSIAKGRMSGGDLVMPMRYCGRFGQWQIVGEAKPAAEAKALVLEQQLTRRNDEDDTRVFDTIRRQAEKGVQVTVRLLRQGGASGLTGVAEKRVPPAVERLVEAGRVAKRREVSNKGHVKVDVLYPANVAPETPVITPKPIVRGAPASKWLP